MNLFILDNDAAFAAQAAVDSHVRKIILEATELMTYAYRETDSLPLPQLQNYRLKGKHKNHPMAKAVRSNITNFTWCRDYCLGLLAEFTFRTGRVHAYVPVVNWIVENPPCLPAASVISWPRCFGDYKTAIPVTDDVVADYRQYYIIAKRHLAIWTMRGAPAWWK